MYIADLTEILCRKKRLPLPASDWVLCLADYSLAIPVDRTVASLEGQTDLALVRAQWALERGLRTGLRRGGDPNGSSARCVIAWAPSDQNDPATSWIGRELTGSASIFKRQSDVPGRMGVGDLPATYKVH